MILPVGKLGDEEFIVIDKDMKGNFTKKAKLGVSYIPLTSKEL